MTKSRSIDSLAFLKEILPLSMSGDFGQMQVSTVQKVMRESQNPLRTRKPLLLKTLKMCIKMRLKTALKNLDNLRVGLNLNNFLSKMQLMKFMINSMMPLLSKMTSSKVVFKVDNMEAYLSRKEEY